jgi:hypothetical protein
MTALHRRPGVHAEVRMEPSDEQRFRARFPLFAPRPEEERGLFRIVTVVPPT